jgi:chemotaxis protein CheX
VCRNRKAIDDEVLDAFGELTNMIIGNFKTSLENQLGKMGLSIPAVVYGKNFSTRSPGNDEWTVIPFSWEDNQLIVRVCLKEKESSYVSRAMAKQEFVLQG